MILLEHVKASIVSEVEKAKAQNFIPTHLAQLYLLTNILEQLQRLEPLPVAPSRETFDADGLLLAIRRMIREEIQQARWQEEDGEDHICQGPFEPNDDDPESGYCACCNTTYDGDLRSHPCHKEDKDVAESRPGQSEG